MVSKLVDLVKQYTDLSIFLIPSCLTLESGVQKMEEACCELGITHSPISSLKSVGDSRGLTWTHLDSLGLTWTHLDSLGFIWTHLDSLGFTWIHLDSLGLTWTHLDSLDLTWIHQDSLRFTRIHQNSLREKGKAIESKGKREMARITFEMHFHLAQAFARTHARHETISRLRGACLKANSLPPTSDLTISFILELQENICKQVKKTYYEAGRHVVDFGDLNIDMFLEVQNIRYSQILHLIKHIVYRLH